MFQSGFNTRQGSPLVAVAPPANPTTNTDAHPLSHGQPHLEVYGQKKKLYIGKIHFLDVTLERDVSLGIGYSLTHSLTDYVHNSKLIA